MNSFLDMEAMEPQIAEVISITRQLTDIGFPVSDQWLTGMIKVKLLATWDTLKMVLSNTGQSQQMSKGVISQILAEEHHHIRATRGNTTAYFTKSMGKGKKKQENRKKCTHCKHRGHNVSECHTLKREQEEKVSRSNSKSSDTSTSSKASGKTSSKGSSNRSSAKVANANADSDSDSNEMIQVFVARTALDDKKVEHVYKMKAELHQSNLLHRWLIDSSASHTMCSHRTWFTHFTPLSKHTKVILGDNSTIPATSTGHIKVHMFANRKWAKTILQDVLYVPDLHSNLLSVSHLAHHGTEVRFIGEHCHIYDRQKSLILKGALHNNLYVMRIQVDGLLTT